MVNTSLPADLRVNRVQDGFTDFTNVAFSYVYEETFSVVLEVWFVVFQCQESRSLSQRAVQLDNCNSSTMFLNYFVKFVAMCSCACL